MKAEEFDNNEDIIDYLDFSKARRPGREQKRVNVDFLERSKLAGIENLEKLLRSMSPELIEGEYVFCTVENAKYGEYREAKPIATFAEEEGLTLVLLKESAEEFGLYYEGTFRCITLRVHSSLEAVGLTAAISAKLSEHQISANIIAAYYHDHVFVPSRFAVKAFSLLSEFSN